MVTGYHDGQAAYRSQNQYFSDQGDPCTPGDKCFIWRPADCHRGGGGAAEPSTWSPNFARDRAGSDPQAVPTTVDANTQKAACFYCQLECDLKRVCLSLAVTFLSLNRARGRVSAPSITLSGFLGHRNFTCKKIRS